MGISSGGFNLIGVNNSTAGVSQSADKAKNSTSLNEISENEDYGVTTAEIAQQESSASLPEGDKQSGEAQAESIVPSNEQNENGQEEDLQNSGVSGSTKTNEAPEMSASGDTLEGSGSSQGEKIADQQESNQQESGTVSPRSAEQSGKDVSQQPMVASVMASNIIELQLSAKESLGEEIKNYVESVEGSVDESVENVFNITIPEDSYSGLKAIIDESGAMLSDNGAEGQSYTWVVIKFK